MSLFESILETKNDRRRLLEIGDELGVAIREQRTGAEAVVRKEDATTQVDKIMMKQKEITKAVDDELKIKQKISDLQENRGLSEEFAKQIAEDVIAMDQVKIELQNKQTELKDKQKQLQEKGKDLTKEELATLTQVETALKNQSNVLDDHIEKRKKINQETERLKVSLNEVKDVST